jgi:thiamine-phosphate pyrophosphorylase
MSSQMFAQIIDANINRVSEGLRVIEEYVRFVACHAEFTAQLAALRRQINQTETSKNANLMSRNTAMDMRAKEIPVRRSSIQDILIANFKRVEEGLRVLEEYTGNAVFNQVRYDVYMLEKAIVLLAQTSKINPGLYLISDNLSILEQGMKWGCSLVQLRDKKASKRDIWHKAVQLKSISEMYNIPWVINDHIDIALSVGASGLHTGQDDLPVAQIRDILGPQKLIGRTTHDITQGQDAQSQGADYVSVGPIWETPSKPGRDAIGTTYLRHAQTKLSIPYVAIGGINQSNISEIMSFSPPLVGVIRDYQSIPEWRRTYFQSSSL